MNLTGLLRRLGPVGRRLAWDREYRRGPGFSGERSPLLLALLRRHCAGARVVELACGDGSLARALGDAGWRSYHGIDISPVAIARAREAELPGQGFAVGDMESWRPEEPLDLLIVEEAIMYLQPADQLTLLDRAFAAMPDTGRAVVTVHSTTKFAEILARLRTHAELVEEEIDGARTYLVLASKAEAESRK